LRLLDKVLNWIFPQLGPCPIFLPDEEFQIRKLTDAFDFSMPAECVIWSVSAGDVSFLPLKQSWASNKIYTMDAREFHYFYKRRAWDVQADTGVKARHGRMGMLPLSHVQRSSAPRV
jgi:hypothetical protein